VPIIQTNHDASSPLIPFLIGPPVIRIRPKLFRISGNSISNRRKMPTVHRGRFCGRRLLHPERSCGTRLSRVTSHGSPVTALIGPPVIRILRKPFRISVNSNSNQHKMRLLHPGRFCGTPYLALALSASHDNLYPISTARLNLPPPAASQILIGAPAIRTRRNPPGINNMNFSNRRVFGRFGRQQRLSLTFEPSRTYNPRARITKRGEFTSRRADR
jgi:hypothetical protein